MRLPLTLGNQKCEKGKKKSKKPGRSFNEVICKKNAIRVSAKNEDGLVNHWHLISKVNAHGRAFSTQRGTAFI